MLLLEIEFWPPELMSSSSDDFVNGIKLRGDGSVDDNSGSDIYGDDLDNDLRGDSLDDRLDGRGGRDILRGLQGSDRLRGGQGSDDLYGGQGDDICNGGRGSDSMSGGDGRDIFVMSRGRDLIRDFSTIQGDIIQINRSIFGTPVFVATPDGTGTVINHAFGSTTILGITPEALQNPVNINYIF